MYSVLSKYYDQLMQDFNYDTYKCFIEKNIIGKKGLDLACGSGEMTLKLKKDGYDMVGADYSEEMLNNAILKARKSRVVIPFATCDLNHLSIENRYDFILSVCDGFNYVTSKNSLKNAFLAVYGALNKGGTFIFDISSEYKLKNIIGDNLFFEDNDDLTYFWQNTLYKDRVEMELTFFEKDGDIYNRFDEEQTQYIYSKDTIFGLLTEVGFSFTFYNENFKEYNDKDSRLVVCAKK